MTEPEKLDLRSHSVADDRRRDLLKIFPEIRTESDGVDFERLKLALGEAIDVGKERYVMHWPGKAECFRTIQAPSLGTLRPCPEESVNFETTENVVIEGDNLEVLKLLQKAYLGKVKMIYIDPPYNTGNDFIYPDNYADSLQTYLAYTGQVDAEGRRFSTNSDTDGRFHSKWLNMMYPRLYLARNLLREDGVAFISIDDNEAVNLRLACNEIFGEENFVAQLFWEKGRKNDAKLFSVGHDYILVYVKSKAYLTEQKVRWREAKPGAAAIQEEYLRLRSIHGTATDRIQHELREFYAQLPKGHPSKKHARYSNVDARGVWRDDNMSWPGGGGPTYDVVHPTTHQPCRVPEGGWRYSTKEKMQQMIDAGRVLFRVDHTEPPIRKTYLVRGNDEDPIPYEDEEEEVEEMEEEEEVGIQVAGTYFYRSGLQAANLMLSLFGAKVFDNPKDHEVLARWISYVTAAAKDALVLDFFAGSGTTGHAVMAQNAADGGCRRFILVQLPEPLDSAKKDQKAAAEFCYSLGKPRNIAELTKERLRRAAKKIEDKNPEFAGDLGFRVFKLAASNFNPWQAETSKDAEGLAKQLELHVDHIRKDRNANDLLREILLKSGITLVAPVETLSLAGKCVHSVADGALLLCLERALTLPLIRAMAKRKPERVVCLDEGFAGNDQLKANAVQIFKTEGVTSFKTV